MFVVGGESLIDLVSAPVGRDGVIQLTAHQGGSPYNCALALSKLGNDTGFLCPISQDGLGAYLQKPLEAAGVEQLLTARVPEYTTLAVVTFNRKKEASYGFYRQADRAFSKEGLLKALPKKMEVFQIGGFCPIEPEDAEIWMEVAKAAAARGATLSMDPNVRPSLVADFAAYKERLSRFLDLVHLVKVSIEDLMALEKNMAVKKLPKAETEAILEKYVADFLARPNMELVVVTFGDKGSRAYSRSGGATSVDVHKPKKFGDTVGAGDSLMAGVLTILNERKLLKPGKLGKLTSDALDDVLSFGAVVAGLNCAHKGCHPPTRAEVDRVLAG